MKSPTLLRPALAVVCALSLCACGSVEYRQDYQSMAIEVIEGNFVESTNDSEIVYTDLPSETFAASVLVA